MKKIKLKFTLFCKYFICLTQTTFFYSASSIAQIVPDQTLPSNSAITHNGKTLIINEGTTRGNNLFHSFKEFAVPKSIEANFNNAFHIQNIFTRVTGSSISNIDGIISANGTANLFFINPNGIVFGANAQLNIGGSFLATTANQINFADNTKFSSTQPEKSTLTVNIPIGLGFARASGDIRVQDVGHNLVDFDPSALFVPFTGFDPTIGLQVNPGKTLALIGSNLSLNGGVLTAGGGNIELGSVDRGFVRLSPISSGWTFDYGDSVLGSINLASKSLVDASGVTSGSIQVRGNNIKLSDGSIVLIQNQGLETDGDLVVKASNLLEIEGVAEDFLSRSGINSETVAKGQGANIFVSAPRILVEDGSLFTTTYSSATGGELNISAQDLTIDKGGTIGTTTDNIGNGGSLNIDVAESIKVARVSFALIEFFPPVFSAIATNTRGSGNGGDIDILTKNLFIQDQGSVGTNVIGGTGKGGDITVDALNSVRLTVSAESTGISTLISTTFGIGDAGTVTINTPNLFVQNGSEISASTFIAGKAGNLIINAPESIRLEGGSITSSAQQPVEGLRQQLNLPPGLSGSSGNIDIDTSRLNITDGAQVTVTNQGTGNAGTLQIDADSIFLDNAGRITASTASGVGGNISIDADSLRLNNGSTITSTSGGAEAGGNIDIDAEAIALDSSSFLANSEAGLGGNITLDTDSLQLFDNSLISASAGGTGNGGNVNIEANVVLGLDNSDIIANAVEGNGGNIRISANRILGIEPREQRTQESDITADSELGIDGTVEIDSPDKDSDEEISRDQQLELESINQLLAGSCLDPNRDRRRGRLVYIGRGGVPETPYNYFDYEEPIVANEEIQNFAPESPAEDIPPVWEPGDPVVEPSSVETTPDGRTFLVAEATMQSAESMICTKGDDQAQEPGN